MKIKQKLLNFISNGFTDKNGEWHDLKLEFLNDREGSGEIHYGVIINCYNHIGKRAGTSDVFCQSWSDIDFKDALSKLDWKNRKKCEIVYHCCWK